MYPHSIRECLVCAGDTAFYHSFQFINSEQPLSNISLRERSSFMAGGGEELEGGGENFATYCRGGGRGGGQLFFSILFWRGDFS